MHKGTEKVNIQSLYVSVLSCLFLGRIQYQSFVIANTRISCPDNSRGQCPNSVDKCAKKSD